MVSRSNSVDRFSLKMDGKVDAGIRMTVDLDLNVLAEELVDRLDEDDLVDFLVGMVELFDDIGTTKDIMDRLDRVLHAQEKAAFQTKGAGEPS